MAFRREAILLENGQPFGTVMEDWQRLDFQALDDPAHRHAYLERPRGHSKTGDLGSEAVLQLVLGPPGQRLYCAAADEDQARLLYDDVVGKFERSPLLAPLMRRTRGVLTMATGSSLRVLAADAPSAYGLRPDWIAIDELSEWRRRELWDSLWSATGKRPRCRMLVISTAGWDRTSIAWEVREIARNEPDWYFSSRGPCAGWISDGWREQQRRTLPPHVYARLHENRWVEGVGAFLTAQEVDSLFSEVLPVAQGEAAYGLDLGLAKDRTVLSRVRRDARTDLVVVEALETWTPRPGAHVDLMDVEETVATLVRAHPAPVYLDPWQGVLLGQRLRGRGLDVHEVSFTGESRRKLFGVVLDLVRTGRLRCRPHAELRRELLGLEVQETAAGWRVDHRVGRHDDHIVSIALAAHAVATRETGGGPVPILGETIRFDLAAWRRPAAVRPFNTGAVDWGPLDAEDRARRARYGL